MKALILISSLFVSFISTSVATADQPPSSIIGQWISEATIGYAPALNRYSWNHFDISEAEFHWTRLVGRHNEKTVFEYELLEDGTLNLYSENMDMQGQLTNKGKTFELCFPGTCFELYPQSALPIYDVGRFDTPLHGIAWDWQYGKEAVSYEFDFTPYPDHYNAILPHGYALNFQVGKFHFIGIYISAFVGLDNLESTDYAGSLGLFINRDGVAEPLNKEKPSFRLRLNEVQRIEVEYEGELLSLEFRITPQKSKMPPGKPQRHQSHMISPLF